MIVTVFSGLVHGVVRDCRTTAGCFLISAQHTQVGDFDLSRVAESDPTASNLLTANNPRWLAPEVITSQVRCTQPRRRPMIARRKRSSPRTA